MLNADGFFGWAVREPGPPDRAAYYNAKSSMQAIFHHSMEGRRGSYSALTDPARYPTAWHGTVAYDGTLYQHYDVRIALVASNAGNFHGPAFELEGLQDEPINAAQIATYLRIHRDIADYTRREFKRVTPVKANLVAIPATDGWLLEHRQVGPTACPSERYAPLWAALAEKPKEEELSAEDKAYLAKLRKVLPESELDTWIGRGNVTLITAYGMEQNKLGTHLHGGVVSEFGDGHTGPAEFPEAS